MGISKEHGKESERLLLSAGIVGVSGEIANEKGKKERKKEGRKRGREERRNDTQCRGRGYDVPVEDNTCI